MRPSVFMVFWRYASQIVITLPGQAKGNIALRTQRHFPGENSMNLEGKSVLNNLFACRVRFHKYAGIDDLDAWPAVKVSNSLRSMQNGLLTNRKAWVERIEARPAAEIGLKVGK
jgi:hypothetical protein